MATETGTTGNDTFTFKAGDTYDGSAGTDTLVFTGTAANLSTTTVTSVEILQAGNSGNTVFRVDPADLVAGGSVIGSTGTDTLTIVGTAFDLRSTTLASIEKLVADTSVPTASTVFTVDQKDLISGGTVQGTTNTLDELRASGPTLDLTSTVIDHIDILSTVYSKGTTFTLDAADLADVDLTTITGGAGKDTLMGKDVTISLLGRDVTGIETIKAGLSTSTHFQLDTGQLKADGGDIIAIVGGAGLGDKLEVNSTNFDLSATTLSSIEQLSFGAAGTDSTTFIVDQSDLAKGGSVLGSSNGEDTLLAAGATLNLVSTSLSSIEALATKFVGKTAGTTFTITDTELSALGSISGDAGTDTLVVKTASSAIDLTSISLDSIEVIRTGVSTATTFTLLEAQLPGASGPDGLVTAIVGSSGSDTLTVKGTGFDLGGTTIASIEHLVASNNGTDGTVFTLDQADLAKNGSIAGSSSLEDDIAASGTSLDLTSTTVTGVEFLSTVNTSGTVFTLKDGQFAAFTSVTGDSGTDTLVLRTGDFDITGTTTLTEINVLKASVTGPTTFTVNTSQLAGGGGDVSAIVGKTSSDALIVKGTDFDLSGTSLSSVERLLADSANGSTDTTFTLNQNDLAIKGMVVGNASATGDTIETAGTLLSLAATTLSSIEVLKAGTASDTRFTVTNDQFHKLDFLGGAGDDTVRVTSQVIDLTLATGGHSSVELLGAGLTTATVFRIAEADLAGKGGDFTGFVGNKSIDTLVVIGSDFDLSGTSLTSVERLSANGTVATLFTLDQGDLAAGGSIAGHLGTATADTIAVNGTSLDLTSTTLTGVEFLEATNAGTTFTVDATDLKALSGGISGNGGTNTLIMNTTAFDVSAAVLSDIEVMQAGKATGTTFTVTKAELVSGGGDIDTIQGNKAGTEALVVKGQDFDLGGVTLDGVDGLMAGSSKGTTFTIDDDNALGSVRSVLGGSGVDTLLTHGTQLDLSGMTLTSVEILKSDNTDGTSFIIDQSDLAKGGSVIGDADDAIVAAGTSLDLTSTTLTSIEIIAAGKASATTWIVDQADLVSGGSVEGSTGTDTLIIKGTGSDLTSTTLTSVEVLKSLAASSTFTVDNADLKAGGGSLTAIVGSSGINTLVAAGTHLDLSQTALTNVQRLAAGTTSNTTFTLDQNDLVAGGSVIGSSGDDTIAAGGSSLDLSSTVLTSIENATISSSSGSTLTVTAEQLVNINVTGGGTTTNDTLIVTGTNFDLTGTTFTDFEALKAGGTLGTNFTLSDSNILALGSDGSITGTGKIDALTIRGTGFDLSSTTITSIEILRAGSTLATTFTLDPDDVTGVTNIIGGKGTDTILAAGTALDLSNATLSSVEKLTAGNAADTTFTLTQGEAAGLTITGSTGDDTLVIKGTSFDLTSTTLSSVEILETDNTSSSPTVFIVDQADLASGGTVVGSTNTKDTLIVNGASLDLTHTTLTDIEILKGTAASVTFTLDQDDLADKGSVTGGTGAGDTIVINDASLDLTSTTLSGVEILKAGTSNDTAFTVDQGDLAANGSVIGNSGTDTILSTSGTALDLTHTTLTSVEVISTNVADFTFILDQADLASGGTVNGASGDTVVKINGTVLDLSSTTLDDITTLRAGTTNATAFTVNQVDIDSAGTIIGSSSKGDALVSADSQFDVTSTTLTSIEKIQAGTDDDTTFTVDQAHVDALGLNGEIDGRGGSDTLLTAETVLDLSQVSVISIDALKSTNATGTTFIVDQLDLASAGSVIGAGTTDILETAGNSLVLGNTTLSGIEKLATMSSLGTTFTVNHAQVDGTASAVAEIDGNSAANDTLIIKGTAFDITSITLDSIEILKATGAAGVTFTVHLADLASGGSLIGVAAQSNTLTITGTDFDLSHTALSNVDHLLADTASATFTLDQADLASVGTIEAFGVGGTDIVSAAGSSLDLSSTTLIEIEKLEAGTTADTTFTLTHADLGGVDPTLTEVDGGSGSDTLALSDTGFDVTSTTLSSIEVLKAVSTSGTTFAVDQSQLAGIHSIVGSTETSTTDTLVVAGNAVDLSSTTLTNIDTIETSAPTNVTTFTIGDGQGGATLELTANTLADTVKFTAAYKVADVTDDSTIAAHILTIDNFEDGVGGDKLDLSTLTKGTGTYQDLKPVIDFLQPTTLKEALDIAAHTVVGTDAKVVQFDFDDGSGVATYIVVDNSAAQTLTANDAVIKLVGTHNATLTQADNFNL